MYSFSFFRVQICACARACACACACTCVFVRAYSCVRSNVNVLCSLNFLGVRFFLIALQQLQTYVMLY